MVFQLIRDLVQWAVIAMFVAALFVLPYLLVTSGQVLFEAMQLYFF